MSFWVSHWAQWISILHPHLGFGFGMQWFRHNRHPTGTNCYAWICGSASVSSEEIGLVDFQVCIKERHGLWFIEYHKSISSRSTFNLNIPTSKIKFQTQISTDKMHFTQSVYFISAFAFAGAAVADHTWTLVERSTLEASRLGGMLIQVILCANC